MDELLTLFLTFLTQFYTKMTKNRRKRWRPTKYSEFIVGKLEEAFRGWCSIELACSYAGIHKDTYYDRIKKKRHFSDDFTEDKQREFILRMEAAMSYPLIWCRFSLVRAWISGNWQAALKYLEKKDPEFKEDKRNDITINNNPWFTSIKIVDATSYGKRIGAGVNWETTNTSV